MRRSILACIVLMSCAASSWAAGGTCPSGVPTAITSCFFVSAAGSDSNAGTSEAASLLHAPGMPNCTGTCARTTPAAGEGFIFRGGDAWHRSASTSDSSDVPVGGLWAWTWSGTSANCNYPTVTTSCIYIGVDTSWYNSSVCGASFCRPQFELDNPIWANSTHQDASHHGFITACTYDDYNLVGATFSGNYLIIDNWNVWGKCWAQLHLFGSDSELSITGTHDWFTHGYIHGWTEAYNSVSPGAGDNAMDQSSMLGDYRGTFTANGNGVDYDVFDGSDTICTGANACTGGPVSYDGIQFVMHSICRYMANCFNPGAPTSVHDNLFEYMYESYDTYDHGGVLEATGAIANTTQMVYDNIFRHTDIGITYNPNLYGSLYFFNNVFFDIGNARNCVALANDGTGLNNPVFITNNTFDPTNSYDNTVCGVRLSQGGAPAAYQGTVTLQNNHFIAYSPATLSSFIGTASGVTVTDVGNEVFQTEAVANGQGYAPSNNYAPTSTSGATYHAGANLSSDCSTYSADSALCSGTTGGVTNTAGSGVTPTLYILSPLTRGTTWDAGAYEFSGQTVSMPAAPSGLVA